MGNKHRVLQRLKIIATSPHNTYIIHYSCESFKDKVDGYSPRISSIAVKDFDSAQTYSFSIHKTAELEKVSRGEIEKHYDTIERKMLDEFFDFLNKDKSKLYVHWNMRNATYGFQAIYHRYRVLGGIPTPLEENRLFDLPELFADLYGQDYAEHPKLEKLADMNALTKRDFMKGADEAEAFNNKEYYRLHLSTLRKVDIISEILHKQIDGTLRTKINPWIERIKDVHEHWSFQLAEIVLAIVGLVTLVDYVVMLFRG